jgi:hypothetical protein
MARLSMSGGSIPSCDSTTYRAHHKFHSRIGTQSALPRKRSPCVETERKVERRIAYPPSLETLRQYNVQCIDPQAYPQMHNVSCKRIDFGVAHDAVSKLGVAIVPGVELGEAAAQPLFGVEDGTQSARIRQRIALHRQSGARKEQLTIGREMGIHRMPLHASSLGDGADARARRPQFGMQVNRRLDDTPTRFCLILRAALQRIRTFPVHYTLVYSHIDRWQEFNYTPMCNEIGLARVRPFDRR